MERRITLTKCVYCLFLLFTISTSVIPIILASDLISLTSYEQFTALLERFYIPMSYFAKIILANLDYIHFNVASLFTSLLTSLSIMNGIILICIIYLWAASQEKWLHKRNFLWKVIVGIYVIGYMCIAGIIIFNFKLTSLNDIIHLFQYAGLIMMMTHIVLIACAIYGLYKEVKIVMNHIRK
ncbi:MAG: hypothetical protein EOM50_05740 [Erysipelotrichia bacterium]|nr:hypothetical protein [Erysipelotrichia bacterium]NCC55451.1 hypothetical protein [Erysipelotrichia bacterium]